MNLQKTLIIVVCLSLVIKAQALTGALEDSTIQTVLELVHKTKKDKKSPFFKKEDKIIIQTKDDLFVKGHIKEIKEDTIIVNDSRIAIRDIKEIKRKSFFGGFLETSGSTAIVVGVAVGLVGTLVGLLVMHSDGEDLEIIINAIIGLLIIIGAIGIGISLIMLGLLFLLGKKGIESAKRYNLQKNWMARVTTKKFAAKSKK